MVVDFRQTATLDVTTVIISVKEDTSVLLKGISVQGVLFCGQLRRFTGSPGVVW